METGFWPQTEEESETLFLDGGGWSTPESALEGQRAGKYVPGRVFLRIAESAGLQSPALQSVLNRYGASVPRPVVSASPGPSQGGGCPACQTPEDSCEVCHQILSVQFDAVFNPFEVAAALSEVPGVAYAEPVPVMRLMWTPNDPGYSGPVYMGTQAFDYQHYLHWLNVEEAWDYSKGSADVVVAVIDSSVDINHPELRNRIWINPAEDANASGRFDHAWDLDGDGLLRASDDVDCSFQYDCGRPGAVPGMLNVLDENMGYLGIQNGADINGADEDGNGFVDDVAGWNFKESSPYVNSLRSACSQQGRTHLPAHHVDCDVHDSVSARCDGTLIKCGILGTDGQVTDCDYTTLQFASHGMPVSGIIAAEGDNGTGLIGIAPGVKILPLRIHDMGCLNFISGEDILRALCYAANLQSGGERVVDVINMSFAGSGYSQAFQDVISYVAARDIVMVAAAANDDNDYPFYPAAYNGVLSVANVASTTKGNVFCTKYAVNQRVRSSGYGPWVDLSAPGHEITSLEVFGHQNGCPDRSRFTVFSGTSAAAPMVAGVAALVRSRYPEMTAEEVRRHLTGTARNASATQPVSSPWYMGALGGHCDAGRALRYGKREIPRLVFEGRRLDDSAQGNGDGMLQPGETADLFIRLRNLYGEAQNVSASLKAVSSNVTVLQGQSAFADAEAYDGANPFTENASAFSIRISSTAKAGDFVLLDVNMQAEGKTGTPYLDTERIALAVGRPSAKDGFPFRYPEDAAGRSVHRGTGEAVILDFTGDGRKEILTAVRGMPGECPFSERASLLLVDASGAELSRSPLLGVPRTVMAAVNVSGGVEVYYADYSHVFGVRFRAADFSWEPVHTAVDLPWGALYRYPGSYGTPLGLALGDVSGDGDTAVIVSASENLFAVSRSGQMLPGFPVQGGWGEPALADMNNDGVEDIVWGNRIFDGSGRELPGSPLSGASGAAAGSVVADLNGDGNYEVIFAYGGIVDAVDMQGRRMAGFPVDAAKAGMLSVRRLSLADLDHDGSVEVLMSGVSGTASKWMALKAPAGGAYAFSPLLQDVFGFNTPGEVLAADLDGDGLQEAAVVMAGNVAGSGSTPQAQWRIRHADGVEMKDALRVSSRMPFGTRHHEGTAFGFPLPAIADLDGDDRWEVVVAGEGYELNTFALPGEVNTAIAEWPVSRRDMRRTGRYGSWDAPAAPAIDSVEPAFGLNTKPTDVVIRGSGFMPGCTAVLNGLELPNLQFVGESELRGMVPAGFAPGPYAVSVVNPTAGFERGARLSNAYTVLGEPISAFPSRAYLAYRTLDLVEEWKMDSSTQVYVERQYSTGAGSAPSRLAASPDGRWVVAALQGASIKGLAFIRPGSADVPLVVGSGALGKAQGLAFTPDSQRLAVSFPDAGLVKLYSVSGLISDSSADPEDELGSYSVGSLPEGLALTPDGNHALVANKGSNSLSWLDLNAGVVTAISNGALNNTLFEPNSVAVSRDGTRAAVTNRAKVAAKNPQEPGYVVTLNLTTPTPIFHAAYATKRDDGSWVGQRQAAFDEGGGLLVAVPLGTGSTTALKRVIYFPSADLVNPMFGEGTGSNSQPANCRVARAFPDRLTEAGFIGDRMSGGVACLAVIPNLRNPSQVELRPSSLTVQPADVEVIGLPNPVVTSVWPAVTCSGGPLAVNVVGSGFHASASLTFREHHSGAVLLPRRVVHVAPSSMLAYFDSVPAGAYDVEAANPYGLPGGKAAAFAHAVPAALNGGEPAVLSAAGGTPMILHGENFMQGVTRVFVDGAEAAAVEVLDAQTLQCLSPALSEGVHGVTVENGNCQGGPSGSFAVVAVSPGSVLPLGATKGTTAGRTELELLAAPGSLAAGASVYAQAVGGISIPWEVLENDGSSRLRVRTAPAPAGVYDIVSEIPGKAQLRRPLAFTYADFGYVASAASASIGVLDAAFQQMQGSLPSTLGGAPVDAVVSLHRGWEGRLLYGLTAGETVADSALEIFETGSMSLKASASLGTLVHQPLGLEGYPLHMAADPLAPWVYVLTPKVRPIGGGAKALEQPGMMSVIRVLDESQEVAPQALTHTGFTAAADSSVPVVPVDVSVPLVALPPLGPEDAGKPVALADAQNPVQRYAYVTTAGTASVETSCCQIADPLNPLPGKCPIPDPLCRSFAVFTGAPHRVSVVDMNPYVFRGFLEDRICTSLKCNPDFAPNPDFGRQVAVLDLDVAAQLGAEGPFPGGSLPLDLLGLTFAKLDGKFVYVVARERAELLKLDAETNAFASYGAGPAGISSQVLLAPHQIERDADGNYVVTDGLGVIYKYDAALQPLWTSIGQVSRAEDVASFGGGESLRYFVSDMSETGGVLALRADGSVDESWGAAGRFALPNAAGLAVDSAGRLYVSTNEENGRILRLNTSGTSFTVHTENLSWPRSIALDEANGHLVVAEVENGRLLRLPLGHGMCPQNCREILGELTRPMHVETERPGVFVATEHGGRILRVDTTEPDLWDMHPQSDYRWQVVAVLDEGAAGLTPATADAFLRDWMAVDPVAKRAVHIVEPVRIFTGPYPKDVAFAAYQSAENPDLNNRTLYVAQGQGAASSIRMVNALNDRRERADAGLFALEPPADDPVAVSAMAIASPHNGVQYVFTACFGSDSIVALDAATREIAGPPIPMGAGVCLQPPCTGPSRVEVQPILTDQGWFTGARDLLASAPETSFKAHMKQPLLNEFTPLQQMFRQNISQTQPYLAQSARLRQAVDAWVLNEPLRQRVIQLLKAGEASVVKRLSP